MVHTLARSFLVLGLFLGPLLPAALADDDQPRRITVNGRGKVEAVPDVATLSIGVETEAKTPGEALADNALRMTAVMDRLNNAGVKAKDMQTSQLGIWPIFAERQQPRITVAYRASNQLTVTIREVERLGSILDEAVADGANRVNGPTFSVADPEPLLAKAREAAVMDAIVKAERIAAAAGVELGEVLSIDEGSGGSPILARHMRADAMAASTPVAPGETTIAASVTMAFEID